MGSLIQLCIEIKVNGEWEYYDDKVIMDEANVFSRLLGKIEGCKEPVCVAKDIPGDISMKTQEVFSWVFDRVNQVTFAEADEIEVMSEWALDEGLSLEIDIIHKQLFGGLFGDFNKHKNLFPEWLEDVRFIFWAI